MHANCTGFQRTINLCSVIKVNEIKCCKYGKPIDMMISVWLILVDCRHRARCVDRRESQGGGECAKWPRGGHSDRTLGAAACSARRGVIFQCSRSRRHASHSCQSRHSRATTIRPTLHRTRPSAQQSTTYMLLWVNYSTRILLIKLL